VTHILLVTGSTRGASTNTAALRTAHALSIDGVDTVFYDGLSDLPPFNPDHDTDPPPPPIAGLRAHIAAADAILFCTPEYAGSLPGTLKNLLDWTVKGGEMEGKPVASLNVAAPGRGDQAQAMLRTVLGYVAADFIEAAWVRLPVPREAVAATGVVDDPVVRTHISDLLIFISRAVTPR
jgi:NAD(P)H-dependent FMN reductase